MNTTEKNLEQKSEQANELLTTIERITKALIQNELSLRDIDNYESDLETATTELRDTLKDIIDLRLWNELENGQIDHF